MHIGSPALALLVLALPAASFLLIAVIPALRRTGRVAAAVSVAAMGGALAAAIVIVIFRVRRTVEADHLDLLRG